MSFFNYSRRVFPPIPSLCSRCSRISQSTSRRWHHTRPAFDKSAVQSPNSRHFAPSSKRILRPLYSFPPPRRRFTTSPAQRHGDLTPPKPGEERHVTFIDQQSVPHTFTVADGDNLLDIAQHHELEMEGACGGSCACSTCHVIVTSEEMYDKMEEPSDDENDMLDLAFGLTETSRLGCQIVMNKELDGLEVKLPAMTRNLQASDFEKKA